MLSRHRHVRQRRRHLNDAQQARAGLVWRPEIAHLIREHNNANVIVFPGRFISEEVCRQCLDEFFATEFAGGRHQQRIDDIPVK
jgi:ribose 5-phosphate isomerase B